MDKGVLISIQPYWVFLIIAKIMGWNIGKEKTVEIRKNYPKADNWNKIVKIYCGKDKKSFAKIPKEYQPLMQQFLGKIIGEFVCDEIDRMAHCGTFISNVRLMIVNKNLYAKELDSAYLNKCQLSYSDIDEYSNGGDIYGWHISDLVIYDKPKELGEFKKPCNKKCNKCDYLDVQEIGAYENTREIKTCLNRITRPPQSWCYVEVLENA